MVLGREAPPYSIESAALPATVADQRESTSTLDTMRYGADRQVSSTTTKGAASMVFRSVEPEFDYARGCGHTLCYDGDGHTDGCLWDGPERDPVSPAERARDDAEADRNDLHELGIDDCDCDEPPPEMPYNYVVCKHGKTWERAATN